MKLVINGGEISLIVLNWHDEESTLKCVESIRHLDTNRTGTVIIVDNAGSADTAERLKAGAADCRLVSLPRNLGYTGGMNAGIAFADGAFTAILNNDLWLGPAWLEEGLRAMEDPRVAIVGGRSYIWDEDHPAAQATSDPWSCPVIHPDRGFWRMLTEDVPQQQVAAVDGSDLLVRTSVLKQLTGFDDSFFAYYEDADICARTLALGFEIVFVPAMESWHRRGHSAKRIPFKRTYLAQRNRLIFIAKHWPNSRWLVLTVRVSIEYLMRGFLGRDSLRKREGPQDATADQLPVALAGIWGLVHLGNLWARRRRVQRSGQHDEGYVDRLVEIYGQPPFAQYLSSDNPKDVR